MLLDDISNRGPNKKVVGGPRSQIPSAERPRATGRVFAITSTKATRLGNLI